MKKIPYRDAIGMQPDVLAANRKQLVAAAGELRGRRSKGGVVGILGIGASYYSAVSAVRELWKLGVRSFPIDAGQLWEDDFDVADTYIAISASGESLETVAAVQRLRDRGKSLIVSITAEHEGTLTSIADLAVACAQLEDSVPATTSYLGSLQALAFLASAWESAADTARLEEAWASVPEVLHGLLDQADAEVADVAQRLAETSSIDFVGTPDSAASAAEGALLYREAPRLATAWFDSRSYLHGPMESLEPGRGIVVVGDGIDDGVSVILRQVRQIGCVAAHLTTTSTPRTTDDPVTALHVPAADGRLIRATYEMAVLQLLSCCSAEKLDLTTGKFRYPQPQVKLKQAS